MYEQEKRKLLGLIDSDLQYVLEKVGAFVAGGAITSIFSNREVNDVDIYVPSKKAAVAIIAWAMGREEYTYADCDVYSGYITSFTDRSVTFKGKEDSTFYQVILFDYFSSAEDIFNKFDFTCCMGAYSFKSGEFVLHSDFLKHNSQRTLVFNSNTSFPIVSALRVDKYKQKGYDISKSEFIRVLLSCMSKKIESWDEYASQIGGLYGCVTTDIFDTEKEFSIEEALSQTKDIALKYEPVIQTENGYVEFEDFVVKVHGDDTLLQQPDSPFKEGFYYKRVKPDGSSRYRSSFKYVAGEVNNGGDKGIWVDKDPNEPFYPSEDTVVEIQVMGDGSGEQGTSVLVDDGGGKMRIMGNFLVSRVFKYPHNEFDPILSQYLVNVKEQDELCLTSPSPKNYIGKN